MITVVVTASTSAQKSYTVMVVPDGIQYFETQPASGSGKVLFVRVGQDVPLFDDFTLRLLPAKR